MNTKPTSLFLLLCLWIGTVTYGQASLTLTEANYQHATAMLRSNVDKLIDNSIRPQWLPVNEIFSF